MSRSYSVYQRYISKLFKTDLHLFELSVWLQAFGQGLTSVFIPIILWKLGFDIREIFVFYILFNFIDVPLNLVAQKLIREKGARFVVILGLTFQVVYFALLYNIQHNWTMLLLLAIFIALSDAFYWVGHLYIFASAEHKSREVRKDVSFLKSMRIFGGLFAPLIGAYVITSFDQRTLIFFSTIILLSSLMPLFRMRHLKFKPTRKSMSAEKFFKGSQEKINYLFTSLQAIVEEVEMVILPFFIFYSFGSLESVALVPVFIALAELLLAFYVGKLSVHKNVYKLIALGSFSIAMIWLVRLKFLDVQSVIIGSVLLVAVMIILIVVPIEISIFQRARETEELTAVTFLNLFRMFARGILYLTLFLLGSRLQNSFYLVIFVLLGMAFCARMLRLKRGTT